MNNPFLSIVIPAHNEESRLPRTLGQIFDFLKNQSFSFEVIIVENGSSDRTLELAHEFAAKYPNLIVYQEHQRGTGTVLLNSFGFGAGSASVQDYAAKLRQAAQQDPELAQGLSTIGSNNRAGALPTPADMAWLESKAKHSVRQAEGTASEAAGWIADQAGNAVDLFSPNATKTTKK